MREQLTPLGDRIKASVTPVKTFFHPNGAPEGPRVVTADSGFSNGVKRIFA
jgi:hypothetical protein